MSVVGISSQENQQKTGIDIMTNGFHSESWSLKEKGRRRCKGKRAAEKKKRDCLNELAVKVRKLNEPREPISNMFTTKKSTLSELESVTPASISKGEPSDCSEQSRTCRDASTKTVDYLVKIFLQMMTVK